MSRNQDVWVRALAFAAVALVPTIPTHKIKYPQHIVGVETAI